MPLLSGLRRFGGNLLELAQALGDQQYDPISDPTMEAAAGDVAPLLRQRYNQNFRAARAAAVRGGARFYEMNDVAAAQAQPQFDEDLMRAVQMADALKQRRDSDSRRQALLDHIANSPNLDANQKSLISSLPEDQQAKILGELELPSNDRFSFQSLSGGGLVRGDKREGTAEIVVKPPAGMAGGGAGAVGGVSMEARRMAALQYIQTGKVPSFGNSKVAAQLKVQVLNDAAAILAEQGNSVDAALAKQQALVATRSALGQVEKQGAANRVAEGTMLKNFDLAVNLSKNVSRTGVPVIDRWIQEGRKEIAGDAAVTKFHVALMTALSEYAKIKSGGAMSAAQITESAQQEAERLVHPGMTQAQLEAALETVRQDAHNQIISVEEQRDSLTQQLTPFGQTAAPGSPNPTPNAAPKSAADRFKEMFPNG